MRLYTPGDHARRINRKLSAKHTNLLIDECTKETNLIIDIYLDPNLNRETGIDIPTKKIITDIIDDIQTIGRKQRAKVSLIHASSLAPIPALLPTTAYTSAINNIVDHMAKNRKQRMICIFSDFLDLHDVALKKLIGCQTYASIFCFQVPVATYGKTHDTYTLTILPTTCPKVHIIPIIEYTI